MHFLSIYMIFCFVNLSVSGPSWSVAALPNPSSTLETGNQAADKIINVQCFTQPPPPKDVLKKVDATHCYEALQGITNSDKLNAPMQFSRTTGFEVPYRWVFGSCILAIDMVMPDGDVTFNMAQMAVRMVTVIQICIEQNPILHGYGGKTLLGPENEMHLFVIGRTPPRHEWPPSDNDGIKVIIETPGGPLQATQNNTKDDEGKPGWVIPDATKNQTQDDVGSDSWVTTEGEEEEIDVIA